jgi:hypothetical protein
MSIRLFGRLEIHFFDAERQKYFDRKGEKMRAGASSVNLSLIKSFWFPSVMLFRFFSQDFFNADEK